MPYSASREKPLPQVEAGALEGRCPEKRLNLCQCFSKKSPACFHDDQPRKAGWPFSGDRLHRKGSLLDLSLLVDGLQEEGYKVHLANPSAIKQYEGLKHTDDK